MTTEIIPNMTTPTSGNYTLTWDANTTNAIWLNAPASDVQNALTTIIGNHSVVSVSGNAGGPYLVALRPNMVNIKKPHKKWVVEITRSINGKKVRYCKSFNSLAKAQKARDAYNKKHPKKKHQLPQPMQSDCMTDSKPTTCAFIAHAN